MATYGIPHGGYEMKKILEECKDDPMFNGYKGNRVAHRVLIVDDSLFVRKSIEDILGNVGYEIAGQAEDGEEAIGKYFDLLPGVVTMDINMPIMEGLESVEKILERDPSAKIVMVSAMGYQKMVKDAILRGAKNFVVKPIKATNVKQFLKTVKTVAEGN
jgi:two-component system, chemotaxis family, chemotaxis protein CheY